jgi:phosphonate transport system substrate-binding protein
MAHMRGVQCLCLAALAALAACDSTPYRTISIAPADAQAGAGAASPAPTTPVLRFSVASIQSPRGTYAAYTRLFNRIGQLLGQRVELVQRRTYREINDLLLSARIDAALLCTGGYLDVERRAPGAVEVVAIAVPEPGSSYRSLILVPANSHAQALRDLRGKRFAFTDELSMSGRLYALKLLRDDGADPERFFGSITYTGSHDRSIQAVASALVDGAAVHGVVFAQVVERDPSIAERVRVIYRSPPLGAMPLVVSGRLPPDVRARIRRVLLDIHRDPEGAAALRLLGFERFAEAPPDVYASTARLLEAR